MPRIFINYRRQDSEGYVGRLYDHLLRYFERDDIFMDIDSIQPGVDFVQALEDAVAACDVFISIIGPQWLTCTDDGGQRRLDQWNDFVRLEISNAIQQNKVIIPVLVGKARFPAPTDLPDEIKALARRNAVELTHQRFVYDTDLLVNAIKQAAPGVKAGAHKSDPATLREKETALKKVRDDLVNATTSPLYQFRVDSRHYPVLGDGSADARIVFIGEAPGKMEAKEGRPFCGPSGEILDEMLRGIGLKREDVFMTNVLLDHPPDQHDPLPAEIEFYAPFVDRIIDVIQPAVIVPLGKFAMQYMLKRLDVPEKRGKISDLHGMLIKAKLSYGDIHVVPLYHPAVVLYSANQKDVLRKDFEKLKLFV